MAIKERDNVKNRGLRPFWNKHLGRNEQGETFAHQMAMALPHTYTVGLLKAEHFSETERKAFAGFSLIPVSAFALMGGLIIGEVHSSFIYDHDGSINNDQAIQSDLLLDLDDASGYVALTQSDGESYLLYKVETGAFQLYQGQQERSGDFSFVNMMTPQSAAYQSMQLANDFEARSAYPDMVAQDPYYQITFEGISTPFQENDQGAIMRGGDASRFHNLAWEEQDLAALWREAQTYFDGSPDMTFSSEIEIRNNDFTAPIDNNFIGIATYWATALGLLGGVGLARTASAANASSQRRFKKEKSGGYKLKPQ